MGRFWDMFETRAVTTDKETTTSDSELEDIILESTVGAEQIDEKKAMSIPAVAGSVKLLTNSISMLPIKLYKVTQNKEVEEVVKDYRLNLLNEDSTDYMNGQQLKSAIVKDYILHGKAYIYAPRKGNRIEKLQYIPATEVRVDKNQDIMNPSIMLEVQNKKYHTDLFVAITQNSKDGFDGVGLINLNQEALQIMYYTMKNEVTNAITGGMYRGFLQSENKLGKEALRMLKVAWLKMTRTTNNSVAVLNKGITFKEASQTAAEQQLNQNKKTNSSDINTIINVPAEMFAGAYDAKKESRLNKYTISPILVAMESALNKTMLLESEKETHYFVVDTDELNKADVIQRYAAYKQAIDTGFLTIDEVRYDDNRNPLGMDKLKFSLGSIFYDPKTKEIFVPNTGEVKTEEEEEVKEAADVEKDREGGEE